MDDFATITQKRMTGGFRLENIDGKNLHVDPGPGALVRTHQFGLDPFKLDGVFISHAHTDHYNDAEILIESMTKGMTKYKGNIFGSLSVIKGFKRWGPCISKYHLSKSRFNIVQKGQTVKWDNITISGVKTVHGDPTAVGFQLKSNDLTISYTADTEYYNKLPEYHNGADVLIASIIRSGSDRIRGHLCGDDFIKLIQKVKPKLAIMTHLGMKVIRNNPESEARRISKKTNCNVIAAKDGMKIDLTKI